MNENGADVSGSLLELVPGNRTQRRTPLAVHDDSQQSVARTLADSTATKGTRDRVVAVIPTNDEVVALPVAVDSLRAQTRQPDRVIIVVNNPRGDIERVARRTGEEVIVIPHCPGRKAGALNQGLDELIPQLDDDDWVLIQDADSYLDSSFIESALRASDDRVGGVGGVFRGRVDAPCRWGRLLQHLQANEYSRYELDIRRQRGRVLVLTGTATLLRVRVLCEVIAARNGGRLPAGVGKMYDTRSLTEDNELSFALLHLGYRIISPKGCTLTTETMPSLQQLASQRHRWKRGALENLFDYGFTRHTLSYWGRQALALVGLLVTTCYLGSLVYGALFGLHLRILWLVVTTLFAFERMVTVRRRGWKMVLLAAPLVIEMVYEIFLQTVQGRAFATSLLRLKRSW